MSAPRIAPLHDFADRAFRKLLEDHRNLAELLSEAIPALAGQLDCSRARLLGREFLLEDWRRRECDLLFRIPFADQQSGREAFVCVLIEHQSSPDPRMPLRMLLYAALYWERQWREWEQQHQPGEPLVLSPIVPIVFHTGATPWRTHRALADLIAGPNVLRDYAPQWNAVFWDLGDRSIQELLDNPGHFVKTLAVARAEPESETVFRGVYAETVRRLERLSEDDKMRWRELLGFVLSWGLRRRPRAEHQALVASAVASQGNVARQQEVQAMSEAIVQTWEQELLAQGEAQGRRRGELLAYRNALRTLLEERFGALPQAVVRQIETTDDTERLRACIRGVLHLDSLENLSL